jgi:hypothetical protein
MTVYADRSLLDEAAYGATFGRKPISGIIASVGMLWMLAGCATARVPLCPEIAKASYESGEPSGNIDKYALLEAKRLNVQIEPLSAFTADVSGMTGNVEKFNTNYKFVLCAFEPTTSVDVTLAYTNCMQFADEWTKILNSDHPDVLMLDRTLFRATCASGRK